MNEDNDKICHWQYERGKGDNWYLANCNRDVKYIITCVDEFDEELPGFWATNHHDNGGWLSCRIHLQPLMDSMADMFTPESTVSMVVEYLPVVES